jgi:hypothetical protein
MTHHPRCRALRVVEYDRYLQMRSLCRLCPQFQEFHSGSPRMLHTAIIDNVSQASDMSKRTIVIVWMQKTQTALTSHQGMPEASGIELDE